MRTRLSNDVERTKELFGELFRRSSGAEELSFNEGLLTKSEVRSGKTMRVSGSLVMFLRIRNRKFEFLVKFIQIDNEVTSS